MTQSTQELRDRIVTAVRAQMRRGNQSTQIADEVLSIIASHLAGMTEKAAAQERAFEGALAEKAAAIRALQEELAKASRRIEEFQHTAAEQDATLANFKLAFKVARAWGLRASVGYEDPAATAIAKWIDEGMRGPPSFIDQPFFRRWADENGLADMGGTLGLRATRR